MRLMVHEKWLPVELYSFYRFLFLCNGKHSAFPHEITRCGYISNFKKYLRCISNISYVLLCIFKIYLYGKIGGLNWALKSLLLNNYHNSKYHILIILNVHHWPTANTNCLNRPMLIFILLENASKNSTVAEQRAYAF